MIQAVMKRLTQGLRSSGCRPLGTLVLSKRLSAPLLFGVYLQPASKLDLPCKRSALSCLHPSLEVAVKPHSSAATCSLALWLPKSEETPEAPTWGSAENLGLLLQFLWVTAVIFSSHSTKSHSPDELSSPILLIFRQSSAVAQISSECIEHTGPMAGVLGQPKKCVSITTGFVLL